jgi:hypothetical protein
MTIIIHKGIKSYNALLKGGLKKILKTIKLI